jgi:hypothetical protein
MVPRITFPARPAAWVVREVGSHVSRPGCRTHQITLVTTRLDAARYRGDDLAAREWTHWEAARHRG